MKKKISAVIVTAVLALGLLAGCASKPSGDASQQGGSSAQASQQEKGGNESSGGNYELALITDVGTIDDKSFNQGSWEGLEKYAKEHNITHKYYKPAEKSDQACLDAIDLAVKGGAKVIVTPGFLFESPVYNAQTKYPNIKFILIDAEPKTADSAEIKDNVLSIFYAEEQAGYLAGYAAVTEGYRELGFMGGLAVPAVVRFGYGYVQGADAAAKNLGLDKGAVKIKYTYVGNFDASPENQTKAAAWYNEGTECIFACGGGVGNSVMKAAETAQKVVIGVDVDQSVESETVITSAMKNLGDSVYSAIADYYDGKFEGGKKLTLTAKENGIELPMETSKFKKFTKDDYDKLYKGLQDGLIEVKKDTDISDLKSLNTEVVEINEIK
ncbi:BMP family lipoprotein [Johnsonella ignava]|uniref:BMP family lipoprotein n=1 Tax=Johnsonella ignava TaxID=43995 RepID=UPI0023F1C5CE|nr:BMP family ABC transporter substrate-binding protein [Johnsonella ignava]